MFDFDGRVDGHPLEVHQFDISGQDAVAMAVTAIKGLFYRRRIGGVTGNCRGATIRLTEVTVYFTGAALRAAGG